MFTLLSSLLLAGQAATPAVVPDSFSFEVVTGLSSSGWTLDADGKGRTYDINLATGKPDGRRAEEFSGPVDNFAFAVQQMVRFRSLAKPGEGCPIARGDIFGFRLVWVEGGKKNTATFTDSCGGIPVELDEAIRPVNQRIDRMLAVPPADVGASEDG